MNFNDFSILALINANTLSTFFVDFIGSRSVKFVIQIFSTASFSLEKYLTSSLTTAFAL